MLETVLMGVNTTGGQQGWAGGPVEVRLIDTRGSPLEDG